MWGGRARWGDCDMIKAIIFDYGGVLSLNWSIRSFAKDRAEKFNKDPLKSEILISKNWKKARVNKINSKLFWKNMAEFLETDEQKLKKYFIDYYKINKKVLNLIKILKKGYKVALLTNFIDDLDRIIKKSKLREIFDVIITSYETKIAKPDIRIFKQTVNELKIKPEECIFIDNMEKNVHSAKKLGMKTILFKNVRQLKRDLRGFGIDI